MRLIPHISNFIIPFYESVILDQDALDAQAAQSSFHKRSHDNQDPPNNREGENKKKRRKDVGEPSSRSSRQNRSPVVIVQDDTPAMLDQAYILIQKHSKPEWFPKKSGLAKRGTAWFDLFLKSDIDKNENHILGPSTVAIAKKFKELIQKDELRIADIEGARLERLKPPPLRPTPAATAAIPTTDPQISSTSSPTSPLADAITTSHPFSRTSTAIPTAQQSSHHHHPSEHVTTIPSIIIHHQHHHLHQSPWLPHLRSLIATFTTTPTSSPPRHHYGHGSAATVAAATTATHHHRCVLVFKAAPRVRLDLGSTPQGCVWFIKRPHRVRLVL
ncbi:hypothetical protein Tco_1493619 [Tanacetum coccineum]